MSIKDRLIKINENIEKALVKSGRKDKVLLVAVTKTHGKEVIDELINLGIGDIGENYVQEMLKKMDLSRPVRWHFIGHLQRNKVKYIVGKIFLLHSLDSISLAEEINKRAYNMGVVQDVLVQVNQGEETKGGVLISQLDSFIENLNKYPNIKVLGLMAMPPYLEDKNKLRAYFKEIREVRDYLNQKSCYKEPLRELSMGMSHDYDIAIEEGATIVRIGTALLGERSKIKKQEV